VSVVSSFVDGFEPDRYSGTDAQSLVSVFSRLEHLASAGLTLAATRAASAKCHTTSGHRTPEEWLATATGGSVGSAAQLLELGADLSNRPGVEEAFRSGVLSPQRASLITKAAKVNPGREDDLVHGAATDTLTQLRQRCLRVKAEGRSAEDEAALTRRLHERRRCRYGTDDEGGFVLEAHLTPESGARVLSSLTTQSDRLFHQLRTKGLMDDAAAIRADALVALITGEGILPPMTRRQAGGGPTPPPRLTGPDEGDGGLVPIPTPGPSSGWT
jgi:hypothetical protein